MTYNYFRLLRKPCLVLRNYRIFLLGLLRGGKAAKPDGESIEFSAFKRLQKMWQSEEESVIHRMCGNKKIMVYSYETSSIKRVFEEKYV